MSWGLADQALSSGTNFILAVMVARAVSPSGFGAFGVVFSTYLIAVGLARSVVSEPMVVRRTGVSPVEWAQATRAATGAAVVAGAAVAAVVAAAAPVAGGLQTGLLALAATLPGLVLQDAWRFAFFAAGRTRAAFANDLVWAVLQIGGIAAVTASGHGSVGWLVAAWGIAGTAAGAMGTAQTRIRPAPLQARGWVRQNWDLSPRYLGEFLARGASNAGVVYVVGAVSGFTAAGVYRAGQVVLGPLNVLNNGLTMVGVPEAIRSGRAQARNIPRVGRRVALCLASASVGWGGLLLAIPRGVGEALFHHVWAQARGIVIPVALLYAAIGVITGASIGFRALAAARQGLKLRVCTGVSVFLGGLVGACVGGAAGAAWGCALMMVCWTPVWWWRLRVALKELPGNEGCEFEPHHVQSTATLPEGARAT